MIISDLIIENYRNLSNTKIKFNKDINLIIGQNGSGKTNLLEAIYYLAYGKSFKNTSVARIIATDREHFILHAKIIDNKIESSVAMQVKKDGIATIKINGQEGKKLSDIAKLLPIQIISPEKLNFFNAGPAQRRAYLDWALFYQNENFYTAWNKWRRLLKQRNAAINKYTTNSQIQLWDELLAIEVNTIDGYRQKYINNIIPAIKKNIRMLLPDLECDIAYYSGWDTQKSYLEILQQTYQRDKELGYTVAGPQRADLKLKFNNIAIENILSRGQLKLIIIALKLAQIEYLADSHNKNCILLLDDFSSELDSHKKQLLSQKLLTKSGQIFITSINENNAEFLFQSNTKLFQLNQGMIHFV